MGNSGACWGLSMKGLKARIKVHIKLRKGKGRERKRPELIDCKTKQEVNIEQGVEIRGERGVGGTYTNMVNDDNN